MTLYISQAVSLKTADALTAQVENGVGDGKPSQLNVYGGTRPATPDTAPGAAALVTFNLPAPAFKASTYADNKATAVLNTVTAVTAATTGTATFFRVLSGDGKTVVEGTCTDVAGDGDVKLSSVDIVAGIDVTVVSYSISLPAIPA